uniref:Uncharacterized protein n=1 Tax=Leersia perrieri TaxID=77586 RepID=A0A0D9WI46_9ORYZ
MTKGPRVEEDLVLEPVWAGDIRELRKTIEELQDRFEEVHEQIQNQAVQVRLHQDDVMQTVKQLETREDSGTPGVGQSATPVSKMQAGPSSIAHPPNPMNPKGVVFHPSPSIGSHVPEYNPSATIHNPTPPPPFPPDQPHPPPLHNTQTYQQLSSPIYPPNTYPPNQWWQHPHPPPDYYTYSRHDVGGQQWYGQWHHDQYYQGQGQTDNHYERRRSSSYDSSIKQKHIDFPVFDGDFPEAWIRKADKYFALNKTPEEEKVLIAEISGFPAMIFQLKNSLGRNFAR